MRVAIGTVLYGNSLDQVAGLTSSAQKSLERAGLPSHEALLFYDNSEPDRRIALPHGVTAFVSDRNLGFGAGHNVLMAKAFAAGAEVYIGANPDGAFHPDTVTELLGLHARCGGDALIEAQQFPNENLKHYDLETLATPWISGACFLVPKVIFEATGGFDEEIFLYCEDVDFSWSARRKGFRLLYCPTALFYHDLSERDDFEPWRYGLTLTSGRYLAQKWNSDTFRDWCEAELDRIAYDGLRTDLGHIERIREPDETQRFAYGFAFSPERKELE